LRQKKVSVKTYQNEQHGFEIKVPEEWSLYTEGGSSHPLGRDPSLIFRCRSNEAFNFQIGPLAPEPPPSQTENEFRRYTQEKGYTSLDLGRFNVEGKDHIWARYYMGYGQWSKKYTLVLNGIEYAITATCLDQKLLLEMEKVWDEVVASFHLIPPVDRTASPKSEVVDKHVAETRNVEPQVPSTSSTGGMKAYRNDELGIEIDVPERWSLPAKGAHHTQFGEEIIFGCGSNEAFYITIHPTVPELLSEQMELKFREYALEKGYSRLTFGRIFFEGREHVWVQYYMGENVWVKKYLIFSGERKYEITASCTEYGNDRGIFEQKGKVWDSVVASLRILMPLSEALGDKHEVSEPMGRIDGHPVNESGNIGMQDVPIKTLTGMKTYRNEKHGFEIDIPETWSPAPALAYGLLGALSGPNPPGVNKDCFQYGCFDEAFNFEIGRLFPEPLLDDTEIEFRLYARDRGFTDLHFGRIMAAGRQHVCAHYFIKDNMGERWNKKYMIVFGGIEYTITGTCNDPQWFAKREKDWDAIIQSFRLLAPVDDSANASSKAGRYREKRREIIQERIEMRETTGDLYARAYEAVSMGQHAEARTLLEKCLQGNPAHILAQKELAVVLEKLGDMKGALHHRMEVKRLAPDDIVNRAKLAELLAGSGRRGEALQDVRELLKKTPNHPKFQELEDKLVHFRFADYRILFFSSLITLLLLDIGLLFPGYFAINNVWCMRLMMIMPVYGIVASGPWVGMPRKASGLIAGALYLYFLFNTW